MLVHTYHGHTFTHPGSSSSLGLSGVLFPLFLLLADFVTLDDLRSTKTSNTVHYTSPTLWATYWMLLMCFGLWRRKCLVIYSISAHVATGVHQMGACKQNSSMAVMCNLISNVERCMLEYVTLPAHWNEVMENQVKWHDRTIIVQA